MKITIIGGGGNTAEATGAMLLMKGHQVNFYRFPHHIHIVGLPIRPHRSLSRLQKIEISPSEDYKDYKYMGKAIYIDKSDISKSDAIIIALPSYMMEILPSLLPFTFGGKIVISLCERFHNTEVFFRSLRTLGHPFPKIMISHRSDPFDSNKISHEGINRLWRIKENNDYYITPCNSFKEALNVMVALYGDQALKWKRVKSLWDISFQNINAISHAVTDLFALQENKYIIGTPHYTPLTYTPKIVDIINKVIGDRDLITRHILGCSYLSLGQHEARSYGADGLEDILGTHLFRFENRILKNRPAPVWYRMSGFEDIGWSIVPMEEVARHFGIKVKYVTSLINAWISLTNIDYRKYGRHLGSIIYSLPKKY